MVAVMTVSSVKHAKDFVNATAPAMPSAMATPLKRAFPQLCHARGASMPAAILEHDDMVQLLSLSTPPPLTAACAKRFLSCRKDFRQSSPLNSPLLVHVCGARCSFFAFATGRVADIDSAFN
jgi:hypothetical protein